MKTMKYFLLIILSFLTPLYAKEIAPLVIWTSSENIAKGIKEISKKFETDFEKKVLVEVLNKDFISQFKTAALASKGPDIICWAHDIVGDLAYSGLIEPITIPPILEKSILPASLKAFSYNGILYGYPYDIESVALITNKKLLPTVPQTMEELFKLAEKNTNKDKKQFFFLYNIGSFFFSFPFFSSQGGYIFGEKDGKLNPSDIGLNNASSEFAANFLLNLVKKGIVPLSTDRSISFSLLKENKLAATIDGPWAIAELKSSGISFEVSPIPLLNNQRPRPFIGSHGFIVRRSSNQKELAFEFIEKYLMSKEGMRLLYEYDPRGPTRLDVLEELAEKSPELKGFFLSAKEGIPMPNIPEMSGVWNSMEFALSLFLKERIPPKQALDNAVEQIYLNIKK